MSDLKQKIEHISHNIATREAKLSLLAGEDRREYMKRFKEGKKNVINLLQEIRNEVNRLKDHAQVATPDGFKHREKAINEVLKIFDNILCE